MSWHGALVRYWMYDEDSGEAVETKHYFDQICNGDNKQDKEATAALVEALLLSLRRDVPHVTRLTFQSDNASNYQNAYLGLMLPILGEVHGYYVMRYVHSDTQDGKSMLDAHFATASRKVKSWVRQELIEQDRAHGAELSQQVRPLEKSLSKIIDRANDIFYDFPLPLAPLESGFDLKKVPSYRMMALLKTMVLLLLLQVQDLVMAELALSLTNDKTKKAMTTFSGAYILIVMKWSAIHECAMVFSEIVGKTTVMEMKMSLILKSKTNIFWMTIAT
ncbi:hypothetical protein PHYSODRAFT_339951 [Phytophthora sojae]|uniref:Uncharacterized protein n=1 Tax=Phytophthora sojae (strain P6497) TaxID=1094619 RepID=G5A864_PHYSP|nr:hypothetical protein PHYSODRAFT_339951 [Phytophthora sojae]EGZ08090.1 hypothetical protein PHYSODRAFT_339951 [Phytophthora sojae]|eukprot:XP_009536262.1 hypothetical protein PHYSODRAFT_339951 [Phytophthora sojae]